MNTLSGKSHGRMRKAYCLSSAVHHLDGGRSPYMNRNLLSMECKHSKPSIFYSCAAHFSTILVPQGKKQARKCPFYWALRAFEMFRGTPHYPQRAKSTILTILTILTSTQQNHTAKPHCKPLRHCSAIPQHIPQW